MNIQESQDSYRFANVSDPRRRYPKDMIGAKDEWHALVEHQKEMAKSIEQYQKELKELKQRDIAHSLDGKIYEHMKERENELLRKKQDAENMHFQIEQYKTDLMKQKGDQRLLHKALVQSYDFDLENKNRHNQELKLQQAQDLRAGLFDVNKIEEHDKLRQQNKMKYEQDLINSELQRFGDKKNEAQIDSLKEKYASFERMKEFERKLDLKEQNYRGFYQAINDNQKLKGDLFHQNVMQTNQEREMQLQEIVAKNMKEENERKLRNELERSKARQDNNMQNFNYVKKQLNDKEGDKYAQYMNKKYDLEEVNKQLQEHEEYTRLKLQQKQSHQQQYRNFLSMQAEMAEEQRRMNKMTKEEKKINFGDLQAYKAHDPRLHALIPGYINSKLSPLSVVNDTSNERAQLYGMDSYDKKIGRFDGAISGIGPFQTKGNIASLKANSVMSSTRLNNNELFNGQSNKIVKNERYRDGSAPKILNYSPTLQGNINIGIEGNHDKLQRELVLPTYSMTPQAGSLQNRNHNPITNPLPVNIQNPYFKKELTRISSDRPNRLANFASANLLY